MDIVQTSFGKKLKQGVYSNEKTKRIFVTKKTIVKEKFIYIFNILWPSQGKMKNSDFQNLFCLEAGTLKWEKKERISMIAITLLHKKELFSTSLALKHHQFTRLKRSEDSHLSKAIHSSWDYMN